MIVWSLRSMWHHMFFFRDMKPASDRKMQAHILGYCFCIAIAYCPLLAPRGATMAPIGLPIGLRIGLPMWGVVLAML